MSQNFFVVVSSIGTRRTAAEAVALPWGLRRWPWGRIETLVGERDLRMGDGDDDDDNKNIKPH